MMMPTGRDIFSSQQSRKLLYKPAAMFHETGNKKHALDRMKPTVVIPEHILKIPKRTAINFDWMCAKEEYVYSEIDQLIDGISNIIIVDSKFTGALNIQSSIKAAKKQRSIKQIEVFDIIKPVANVRAGKVIMKCQAVTMANTPCKFKATCGNFCNKHKIFVMDKVNYKNIIPPPFLLNLLYMIILIF